MIPFALTIQAPVAPPPPGTSNTANYIAAAGVIATLLGVLVTWLVMKRQLASKKLTFDYSVDPVLRSPEPNLAGELRVFYRDELLPDPRLLNLNITNAGPTAVENVEVVVTLPGTTYLIPGFFVDVPPGYERLWRIDRTDAEQCTICFDHINPSQVARIRLLMDEKPSGEPTISCAMPNLSFVRASPANVSGFAAFVLETFASQALGTIKLRQLDAAG